MRDRYADCKALTADRAAPCAAAGPADDVRNPSPINTGSGPIRLREARAPDGAAATLAPTYTAQRGAVTSGTVPVTRVNRNRKAALDRNLTFRVHS